MKILCVGQTENRLFEKEIMKQTIKPDQVTIYVDDYPAVGIKNRRIRIAENHKKLWHIVKAYEPDLVWQIEGDCDMPTDALERLLKIYDIKRLDPLFGYVSGVQVGRHGVYAIGAWHVSKNKKEFISVDHKETGVVSVDATGFYCLLAPADVWLQGNATWNGEAWGPDVNWGLSLREKGYKIYTDTDLKIGHRTGTGVIGFDNLNLCTVRFKEQNGEWNYKTWQ